MCGRYTTYTWDELLEVARAITCQSPFNDDPDWPARRVDARPGVPATVIVPAKLPTLFAGRMMEFPNALGDNFAQVNDDLGLANLTWGFLVPWSSRPVINTRIESVFEGRPIWRDAVEHGRCLVVCRQFFEPHREEQQRNAKGINVARQYAFKSQDDPVTLLAGVQTNGRFSVVTTAPNATVDPIHDRMPLTLHMSEAMEWLYGDWGQFANREDFRLAVEPEFASAPPAAAKMPPRPAKPVSDDQMRLF